MEFLKKLSKAEIAIVAVIVLVAGLLFSGILQKLIGRAGLSEAKTNLAAFYAAEKTFSDQYKSFCTDIGSIGVNFTGDLHYNVGFDQNWVNADKFMKTMGLRESNGYANAYGGCMASKACTLLPEGVEGNMKDSSASADAFTAVAALKTKDGHESIVSIDQEKNLKVLRDDPQ
jgi:hypothetical protein